MDLAFFFVDVFAARPLTGNPLVVVPDADGLAEPTMKALAREFHQSETTFVLRSTREGARWRLRSFTPAGFEVGGAGHNALGAWLWLADAGRIDDGDHLQEIGDEVLRATVSRRPDATIDVSMTQGSPRVSEPVTDAAAVAEALGIDTSVIDAELAVRVGTTGVPHLLVPVRGADVVDALAPDARALLSVLRSLGAEGCYVYSVKPRGDGDERTADAYARFFNPTVGIVEDPATGTAAGPLAAHLVRAGRLPDGADVRIDQGHALGRPSRLIVTVAGDLVTLRGSGVVSGEGLMRL